MKSREVVSRTLVGVMVLIVVCALFGCGREVEGDKEYENLSDLANAEKTAEAFVARVQKWPFTVGGGEMKLYVRRDEHGFSAELQQAGARGKTEKVVFGMYDITYDSRVQKVEIGGAEVLFLYEELQFMLRASKEKAQYMGDSNAPSRIYRFVLDSSGNTGLASMLRLVKEGASVVVQMHQQAAE